MGIYTVNVIAGIGTCTNTAANIFTVNALPTVALVNPFVSECENTSAQLDIAGSNTTYNYIWTNGLNTATGTSLNVNSLTQATAGAYTVTATDLNGCQNRTIGNVVAEECITMVPEIFTPNGDGKNEYFHINCIEDFEDNLVRIFNRAGTMVYEEHGYDNIDIYFDGRSNKGVSMMGTNLPDGTYFYVIDKRDGSKPLAGYLEIVN